MPAGGAALHAGTVRSPHLRCSVLWIGPARTGAVKWVLRVRAACVEERSGLRQPLPSFGLELLVAVAMVVASGPGDT
jgi:hypothetical protein